MGGEPHLVVMYNSFYALLDLIVLILYCGFIYLCIYLYMFMRDIGLKCSYNVFTQFWYYNNIGYIERVKKYIIRFYLLKQIVKNWYNFFLQCLVEYTSEPI